MIRWERTPYGWQGTPDPNCRWWPPAERGWRKHWRIFKLGWSLGPRPTGSQRTFALLVLWYAWMLYWATP